MGYIVTHAQLCGWFHCIWAIAAPPPFTVFRGNGSNIYDIYFNDFPFLQREWHSGKAGTTRANPPGSMPVWFPNLLCIIEMETL